jgi:hypothetical protein
MMNGGGELPNEEKHFDIVDSDITNLICSGDFNELPPKSK